MAFGLFFFTLGLLLLALAFALPAVEMTTEDKLATILIGAGFVSAGGAIGFYRSGWEIDRQRGVVQKWWGFIVPLRSKRWPLDRVERVRLVGRTEISKPTHVYIAQLEGSQLADPVELQRYSGTTEAGHRHAREDATKIAQFLGLPLEEPDEPNFK